MSDAKQIERDLRDYLDKEPNLSKADRLTYLQTIFNKHLEVNRLDHLVTYSDLFLIFSEAKKQFVRNKLPIRISGKDLDYSESVHMALMESFVLYLNTMKLLRKIVKFDYKD